MSVGQHLRLRVFLEGQEAPCIGADVSAQAGGAAAASIQVLATDALLEIKPRTLVHLFFYDYYNEEPLEERDIPQGLSAAAEGDDQLSKHYRLLFAGEVVGISFLRSQGARQANLQCLDFTSYWDHARQCFYDDVEGTGGSSVGAFVGAASIGYDSEDSSPGSMLLQLLNTAPATFPKMKGMLGGLIHMLEAVGGIYEGGNRFRGLQDFYSCAELRLHLSRMVGALEADTTSAALLKHGQMSTWLNRLIQSRSNVATFRDILDVLLGKIYYSTISCPAARYVPESTVTLSGTEAVTMTANTVAKVRDAAVQVQAAINWLAASQTVDVQERLQPVASAARLVEAAGNNLRLALRSLKGVSPQDVRYVTAARMVCTRLYTQAVTITGRTVATWAEAEVLRRALEQLLEMLQALAGGNTGVTRRTSRQSLRPSRLHSTLILPECWFTAPPRCNVLFPDLYSHFSFSRTFIGEVTRLRLTTASEFLPRPTEWRDSMENLGYTQKHYYSPRIPQMGGNAAEGTPAVPARVLLPHEVYTGIIPVFENLGNLSELMLHEGNVSPGTKIGYAQRLANYLFFRRRFGGRSLSGSGKFNPYLVAGFTAVVIDRFLSDSMAEENAAGADAVSRPPTQYFGYVQAVSHTANQQGGNTSFHLSHCRTHRERVEFLGVDQQTASRLVGRRLLDASAEDLLRDAIQAVEAALTSAKAAAEEDALIRPATDAVSQTQKEARAAAAARGVRLTPDSDLPSQYRPSGRASFILRPDSELPLSDRPGQQRQVPPYTPAPERSSYIVPVDIDIASARVAAAKTKPEMAGKHKELSSVLAELAAAKVAANAHRWADLEVPLQNAVCLLRSITGKLYAGVYRQETQDLPAEEAIMPPWFSPIFLNPRIGPEVYQPLLGVDSIIEEGLDIEESIDSLVSTYAAAVLRQNQISASAFVREYHRRPIATMIDLLGEQGFHAAAYGDVDAMSGLTNEKLSDVGKRTSARALDSAVDVRRQRYDAVRSYVTELQQRRALRG